MKSIASIMYTQEEMKLAHELASALNDHPSITFYLSCTKKYSHRVLRETLRHVLAIPDAEIKRTRGALFNFIISRQAWPDAGDSETANDDDAWN